MRRPILSIVRTEMPVRFAIVGKVPFDANNLRMTYSWSDSFMAADTMPGLGHTQAGLGRQRRIPLTLMAKKTRDSKQARKISTALRSRLRGNILQILEHMEPGLTWSGYVSKLAKLTKQHRSMCQRILVNPDRPEINIESTGVSIDHLQWLSSALGVTPSDLLSAHFKIERKEPRSIIESDVDRTLQRGSSSEAAADSARRKPS